jgi:hypothetical protein
VHPAASDPDMPSSGGAWLTHRPCEQVSDPGHSCAVEHGLPSGNVGP